MRDKFGRISLPALAALGEAFPARSGRDEEGEGVPPLQKNPLPYSLRLLLRKDATKLVRPSAINSVLANNSSAGPPVSGRTPLTA